MALKHLTTAKMVSLSDPLVKPGHPGRFGSRVLGWPSYVNSFEVRPFAMTFAYAANRQRDPVHAWFRRCIDVKPILDAAATPEDAIAEIKMKYPDWMGDGLLQFSTDTYFMACKMP